MLSKTSERIWLLLTFIVATGIIVLGYNKFYSKNQTVSSNKESETSIQVKLPNVVEMSDTTTQAVSSNNESDAEKAEMEAEMETEAAEKAADKAEMEAAEKAADKAKMEAAEAKKKADAILEADKKIYRNLLGLANLKVVEVSQDGNCMFRGITYSLYDGDDSLHDYVRQAVVNYMSDPANEFQDEFTQYKLYNVHGFQ